MLAIYKKELKGHFTSMTGYVFAFFILLITGFYFHAYNIVGGYPKIGMTLSAVFFIFLAAIPILTMRVLSEERKQKTDQLLLTSPVRIESIVTGKYLALVTVYVIPVLIIAMYPLVLKKFGAVSLPESYTAVLGFFLMGCANIAVGIFISGITESQIIAAVLTFLALFVSYMISGIKTFFPETAVTALIFFLILMLLAAWLAGFLMKSKSVGIAVAAVGICTLLVAYIVKPDVFEGGIQKFLGIFDIYAHFSNFLNGILDVNGIIYYLSVIAVCLLLTVQTITRRRWN